MTDTLLSAFTKAWQGIPRDSLEMEEALIFAALPWRASPAKPRRGETIPAFSLALGEAAVAWQEVRSLAVEEAVAYRIARRWQEYNLLCLGEFAASRLSDADYIEAMFYHYSRGCVRLL